LKHTLVVHQTAVVDARLVGLVNLEHLCLLHYLRGWVSFTGTVKRVVSGKDFYWLHYGNAIEELPLLFNPKATFASLKNQISKMMDRLRRVGLIETTRNGRRLFFRLTPTGLAVSAHSTQAPTHSTKIVTYPGDKTVTPGRDGIVTSIRDGQLPPIYNEPDTKETKEMNVPPLSPSTGDDEDSVISFWNGTSKLPSVKYMTPKRGRTLQIRLADPYWRVNWREAIRRIAASPFLTGGGERGWRADFNWFLRPDSLVNVLEGKYDSRPQPAREVSFMELSLRLKAMDARIKEHPGNPQGTWDGEPSDEEQAEFRKLEKDREALLNLLGTVPES
jgi:hypothetical protein